MRRRAAPGNPSHQNPPAFRSQTDVSVHSEPPSVACCVQTPHNQGGSPLRRQQPPWTTQLAQTSESTLRRRRDEWLRAGVFSALVEEALAGYDRIVGLQLDDLAVDGSMHKAPAGG